MEGYKRDSAAHAARRASIKDQSVGSGGIFASVFNRYVLYKLKRRYLLLNPGALLTTCRDSVHSRATRNNVRVNLPFFFDGMNVCMMADGITTTIYNDMYDMGDDQAFCGSWAVNK